MEERTTGFLGVPWLHPPFPASVALGMPIARHPAGHQNAITDQNQAVGAVPFYQLPAGRPSSKIEPWLPLPVRWWLTCGPFSWHVTDSPWKLSLFATTRRLQAEAAPAQTGSPRSAVLDCPPPAVGRLVRRPDHCQAGDCGFLASCRIPAVLAVAV